MKVKDLMIPLRDYLEPGMTLKEAVNRLQTANRGCGKVGVKGLPVLDKAGKLVGMLSMTDVLRAILPVYLAMTDLGDFTWDGLLESLARKSADKRVDAIMTRDVLTVKEDEPILECVDHMVKKNVRRLPVVDRSGKVVGMIYERDIFLAVTRAMQESERSETRK
jgi:predicted transcriptional regulator